MQATVIELNDTIRLNSLVDYLEGRYGVYFEFTFTYDVEVGKDEVIITAKKTGINGPGKVSRRIPKDTDVTLGLLMELIGEVYDKACRVESVIGIKGFGSDWTCRDFQYELGKTYRIDDLPVVCEHGFHFCTTPIECTNYYNIMEGSKYALVIAKNALIDLETSRGFTSSKVASNTIELVCDITDVYLRCLAQLYLTTAYSVQGFLVSRHNLEKFTEMLRREIYDKCPDSREYLEAVPFGVVSGLGNTMNSRNAQRMAYNFSPITQGIAAGDVAPLLNPPV